METLKRRLIWHGMFLFLLGLLTGLIETQFVNVRMGLAAHLEGVMNGIFLIALGAIWGEIKLSATLTGITFYSALYGTYANWFFTVLAASFGTGALSPITAAGKHALPWQESLVTFGLTSVGVSIISVALLVLWGLREKASS
jgi:(hydroxyamino)benzene mutase|tara:strand:- start:5470 stop:5895 length:426 start_codon:yes stop_codon:yes gene_type:complete